MQRDQPRWTPARVREEEARLSAADRELRSVVAVEEVLTQTADLEYMAAINGALGYRELSQSVYIEADIDAIEAALASGA